jgi:hypothetical protein
MSRWTDNVDSDEWLEVQVKPLEDDKWTRLLAFSKKEDAIKWISRQPIGELTFRLVHLQFRVVKTDGEV